MFLFLFCFGLVFQNSESLLNNDHKVTLWKKKRETGQRSLKTGVGAGFPAANCTFLSALCQLEPSLSMTRNKKA